MAEETKDEDEKKKDRPRLKFPWAGTSIAEEGAQGVERIKKRSSLEAIDELIGG